MTNKLKYKDEKIFKSHEKFINDIKKHFSNFKIKDKDKIIKKVLIDNQKIFTKQFVRERSFYCAKCGLCCKEQGCSHLTKDNKCEYINTSKRSEVCVEFPFVDFGDGFGLFLIPYCKYAKCVAICAINEVFLKCMFE